jgi:hypothetical protein
MLKVEMEARYETPWHRSGAALCFLGATTLLVAQAKPVVGEVVYLKVPPSTFQSKISVWSGVTQSAVVEPSADGAAVNGETNWRFSAFPPLTQYKVVRGLSGGAREARHHV